MNKIVQKNLRRIIGHGEGDMLSILGNESMAGSAGSWENYPCSGANFCYDPNSGEIKYFDLFQKTPKEIKNKFPYRGILRVALNWDTRKFRIVGFFFKGNNINPIVKQNLDETIKLYNEKHGFQ